MKTYTLPHSEWIERTKNKLDALDAWASRLEDRVSKARGETVSELKSKLDDTRTTLDGWKNRWKDARHTAADVWDTVSEEIGTGWEAGRTAMETSLEEIESGIDEIVPKANRARKGDTVFVQYRGRLEDGSEFQSTQGRDPIEFVLGDGNVLPGVERAVTGMRIGEEKHAHIPAEQAYGARNEELVFSIAREAFPHGKAPALGERARVQVEDGQALEVIVRSANDEVIEVDANHPLAGHDLHMDLKLVGIA